MRDVWEAMKDVERSLSGVQSEGMIPSLMLSNLTGSDNLVIIYYKRDGDNIRAISSTGDSMRIIGIPKYRIDGQLLTTFVKVKREEVGAMLNYVGQHKWLVKEMNLGATNIRTRALVIEEREDRYVEIIWRIEDEL